MSATPTKLYKKTPATAPTYRLVHARQHQPQLLQHAVLQAQCQPLFNIVNAAMNLQDHGFFTLSTPSKRPDSERLLYSAATQASPRPPTAPLSHVAAPPLEWAELPPPPSQPPPGLFPEWPSDARLSHIMSYLQDEPPGWKPLEEPTDAAWRPATTPPTPVERPVGLTLPDAEPPFTPALWPPPVEPTTPATAPTPSAGGSTQRVRQKAPAKGWWKTEICRFWKESGGCRNESNCRWAHGDHELRRLDTAATPRSNATPEAAGAGGTTPWSHWVQACWTPNDLPQVWNVLRKLSATIKPFEETNVISGAPMIALDGPGSYWEAVGRMFAGSEAVHCQLCEQGPPGARVVLATEPVKTSLTVCAACLSVADEKAAALVLVPQTTLSEKKKLLYWAITFANFLRVTDELNWVSKDRMLELPEESELTSAWTRHKRHLARAALLMKRYMDALPAAKRMRLLTTELLPGCCLVYWAAAARQPLLLLPLLVCGFPLVAAPDLDALNTTPLATNTPRASKR